MVDDLPQWLPSASRQFGAPSVLAYSPPLPQPRSTTRGLGGTGAAASSVNSLVSKRRSTPSRPSRNSSGPSNSWKALVP